MSNAITISDQRVVTIAGYPIDMFLGTNGQTYFGTTSVRLASVASPQWADLAIDELMASAMGDRDESILIGFGLGHQCSIEKSCLLTKTEFKDCLINLARGSVVHFEDAKTKNFLESQIQEKLAVRFGCKREVSCAYGRVDLLSDDILIEVKTATQWKSAVGQALVYASFFPGRRNIVYLFNLPDKFDIKGVRQSCSSLGIEVMTEDDLS